LVKKLKKDAPCWSNGSFKILLEMGGLGGLVVKEFPTFIFHLLSHLFPFFSSNILMLNNNHKLFFQNVLQNYIIHYKNCIFAENHGKT
jgi:hypothetical protein